MNHNRTAGHARIPIKPVPESPKIESHPEHSLSRQHSACISSCFIAHYCKIEFTYGPKEKTAAVPHHPKFHTVIQRKRRIAVGCGHKAFSEADHRRFAHSEHPFRSEYPVIAISDTDGIVVGINIIIVVPFARQFVSKHLRNIVEVEIKLL